MFGERARGELLREERKLVRAGEMSESAYWRLVEEWLRVRWDEERPVEAPLPLAWQGKMLSAWDWNALVRAVEALRANTRRASER